MFNFLTRFASFFNVTMKIVYLEEGSGFSILFARLIIWFLNKEQRGLWDYGFQQDVYYTPGFIAGIWTEHRRLERIPRCATTIRGI